MIQCKIFDGYFADDKFNSFIKDNNIAADQIQQVKYTTTVGVNHSSIHNIFLLYDDAPSVMFDNNLLKDVQQDLYKYINYTGTPN